METKRERPREEHCYDPHKSFFFNLKKDESISRQMKGTRICHSKICLWHEDYFELVIIIFLSYFLAALGLGCCTGFL